MYVRVCFLIILVLILGIRCYPKKCITQSLYRKSDFGEDLVGWDGVHIMRLFIQQICQKKQRECGARNGYAKKRSGGERKGGEHGLGQENKAI